MVTNLTEYNIPLKEIKRKKTFATLIIIMWFGLMVSAFVYWIDVYKNKYYKDGEKMDKKECDNKITHLIRREIQAPLVSSLIKAFADKMGYDKAMEIVK